MNSKKLSIEEYASWIRDDINSTDLDDSIKNILISLSDEQLVNLIEEVEDRMSNIFTEEELLNINFGK